MAKRNFPCDLILRCTRTDVEFEGVSIEQNYKTIVLLLCTTESVIRFFFFFKDVFTLQSLTRHC